MKGKGIHSRSIFVQLLVFSLLASLVPTLLISIFLFYKLDRTAQAEVQDYHDQITSQYMKNIEEKLQQYRNSLEVIANNTVILSTLTDETLNPYDKGELVSKEVNNSLLLEKQSEVRNCMIYSSVQDCKIYGRRASMMQQASREVWYLQERAMKDDCFSYFALKDSEPILSLVKDIEELDTEHLSRSQLGIIKLDVAMKRLFVPAATDSEENATYDVIVYKNEGEDAKILYQTLKENGSEILKKYWSDTAKEETGANSEGLIDTYTVAGQTLEDYGLNLLFLFDNQDSLEKRAEIIETILPLLLLLMIAVTGVIYWYSKDFSSRVELLVKKFRRAETGDLSVSEKISGTDEIAVLDQQFNRMLGKLDQLIKTSYVQKLENKEAQLKNLQLQINPHFLYNTLETISSIAAVKQVFVVCDICGKLGEIFRYSLGKDYGELVPLEQEMTHIKNYMFIQKIRYGDRLQVFYNIDVDAAHVYIPRFILQPIVENAISHGLSNLTSVGTLEVSAFEKKDRLYIEIEDDGEGMVREKVAEITRFINTAKPVEGKKNIGIRNVNQRIKLAYGEAYGITIRSAPYQGSRFTIQLPIMRKGEEDET
ncbi:sensor histidine kinase [Lachnospiraceae bacterium Marseille-Q4251]|uniref:histidine kinase n=1 Tax=Fusicatenibacter faecihominis TaxID=2881276 RepID=A0AAE3J6V7_9FIRM|nr:sensor histidine kinase [Fusicatenibacter faecihominis]MBR9940123.1 sensor histidine kinase [Lachnospiraceae bacterium Marseille-Q4251]MCC2189870.1 sensor histidine kinase [Fusicatenibacter faecihominis]